MDAMVLTWYFSWSLIHVSKVTDDVRADVNKESSAWIQIGLFK